jgi:hypothetical protein
MCFGDNISFQLLDKGCIERFGPLGISQISTSTANQISFMHSGLIFHYLLIFIVGVLGISLLFFGEFTHSVPVGLALGTFFWFSNYA